VCSASSAGRNGFIRTGDCQVDGTPCSLGQSTQVARFPQTNNNQPFYPQPIMKRIVSLLALTLATATASQAAVTWFFGATPPADKNGPITSAMNTAVANYNTYALYNGNIRVTYNAG